MGKGPNGESGYTAPEKEKEVEQIKPMDRFARAVEYVLKNEGPYSNDPRDPGGATQWGIILTEYEAHLGKKLTPEDVRDMPKSTALAIYKKKFWSMIRGDEYDSDAVAIAIFDTAVNKGLGGCMVCLRDALDQEIETKYPYSDALVSAVNSWEPHRFMSAFVPAVIRYIDARIAKYKNMEWARKGWTNRANRMMELLK